MTFSKTHPETLYHEINEAHSLRTQALFCQRQADKYRNSANPRDAQTWDARANQYRREAYELELADVPYQFETVLTEHRSITTRFVSWMRSL